MGQTSDKLKEAESTFIQNPEKARKKALELYQSSPKEEEKLRVLFLLTNSSNLSGKLTDAIKYGNEALFLAQKENNVITQIKLYAILGNLYQSIPLNEKTKIYLNRAEKLIQTIKIPDSLRYIEANVYYLKGMNYANTLDCAVAVNYFNKAISVYKSTNSPLSTINLKLAYLNKGFCLIEMKDLDNAEQMLKLAQVDINPNSEFLPSFPEIFIKQQNLFVDFGFSKLLAARGQIASSNKILHQFLSKENMPLVQLIKTDIYKQLVDNYLQIGELSSTESFENLYQAERKAVQKKQEELLNVLILAEQKNNKEENQNIKRKYYSLIAIISLAGVFILIFLYMKIKKVKLKRKKIQKSIIG